MLDKFSEATCKRNMNKEKILGVMSLQCNKRHIIFGIVDDTLESFLNIFHENISWYFY